MPEFGRWQDVQRLYGIKRGTLYNLMGEGKVKSVSMRRRGNVHGCRLFYLRSIRDFLHQLLEEQDESSPNCENTLPTDPRASRRTGDDAGQAHTC